jgi:hypothetical protein
MMRLMYSTTLLVHSWLRWAILLAGVAAVVKTNPMRGGESRAGLVFTILLDIQFLIGLALWAVLSPNTTAAIHQNFAAAMHVASVRFFLVEHPTAMVAAVVVAHIGRTRAVGNPRLGRTLYIVALVLLLAGQPWPGLPYGRPLFRF